jgi:hypothetical protein
MSKMDNLRAMREARYEADRARAKASGLTPATKATKPATPPTAEPAGRAAGARTSRTAPPSADATAGGEDALCGHRNMGGRTCTRELGHAAKSHRYS